MKKQESYYMVIPASVWDTDLSDMTKILYGHITVLSNKNGYCHASNSYFTKVLKTSASTVNRKLNELKDLGLINTQLIYQEGTKEVKERRIYMTTGIVTNDNRPVITGDNRPVITDEPDNITRNNNINNNITDDDYYGKIFFKIVDSYPANRIGNRQHGLKKFKQLSKEDAKLAASNLKRYLKVAGTFVKNLQNYITEECWSEAWLTAEENKNKKQDTNSTKTFEGDYDTIG